MFLFKLLHSFKNFWCLVGFPGGSDDNLPAMQETWVWSLGRDVPVQKEMATHSSILAWRTPWTEEPGRPQSLGSQTVKHDWVTNTSLHSLNLLSLLYIYFQTFFFYGYRNTQKFTIGREFQSERFISKQNIMYFLPLL